MITDKLKELNIKIPNAPDPVGAYVAYKKAGNLLFIAGQLPISEDGQIIKGKIDYTNRFNFIDFVSA